jgi:uncharacterized membrane protein
MRIASVGHAVFAATMITVGVLGLVNGTFAAIWEPVPKGVPAREALVYLCAFIALGCGIGLVVQRTAATASRVLLGYLLIWMLLLRGRVIILAPASQNSWSNCAETAVIVAGAWVLYAWFATDWDRQRLRFLTSVRVARVLYGLALIPFGVAHFVYPKETAGLVPSWLPSHLAWAYFTGAAFLVAGVAILVGVCARLAAALSALQIGLFTLLVWVPIVASAGHKDAFQWSETLISLAVTAGAWVVADSYRGMSWLAVNKR